MSTRLWFPCKLWIGGRWVDARSGETFPVTNPATAETLASVPLGGAADARSAIEAAQSALGAWRATSAPSRGASLLRVHDLLLDNRERLAALLTQEQGKPLAQARSEVEYAASFYRWFAEETRRMGGRFIPHADADKQSWVEYHPVGVVGAVTPWNFPLAQGAKKLAAALAAGCTVVLKPASATPLVSLAMAWIAEEAGLGGGLLNVVCGNARDIGQALCEHPAVGAISLTGSTETGAALMSAAGRHIKRTSMELGGNGPFIVLEDADLKLAVDDLMKVKFMSNGQMCVTANRVFVHERIAEVFTQEVLERVQKLRTGNGMEPDTDVGPVIDHDAVERLDHLVIAAVSNGARLLCGGKAALPPELNAGSYYPPTLLSNVQDNMRLAQEEIFGPVIPLLVFSTDDEAVRRANATQYGLAAYIYSRDISRATRMARSVQAGIIGINDMRPLRAEVPFGGIKASGVGQEGGAEGWKEFTEVRVFSVRDA